MYIPRHTHTYDTSIYVSFSISLSSALETNAHPSFNQLLSPLPHLISLFLSPPSLFPAMPLSVHATAGGLPNLEGYRLLWPCVAQGSVGQLAADLFLSTLDLSACAADVAHEGLLPFVGYGAEDGQLLTALQRTSAG